MRVALYARVSTRKSEQRPEIQINELRKYCKARNFKITHEIIDRASGAVKDREGLKKLFKLTSERKIDAVIVLKLDRLFRSLKHLLATIEEFEAQGIKFIAVRDQVDLTTPQGRMFVQILGSLSEFERELIRERVILGLEHARNQGKTLGRPLKTDYSAVQALRKSGLSYTAIQKKLKISKGAVWRALAK